jgi:indolepyruvate ferredoxin oxidoreductase beta subunit
MTERSTNILLSGIERQQGAFAGGLLSQVFTGAGYDAKSTEVRASDRNGGGVTIHFRFGENVRSPLVTRGEVDYFLSFEWPGALRSIKWLRPTGKIIINRAAASARPSGPGWTKTPENIEKVLRKLFKDVFVIDGLKIAADAGSTLAATVALLGALSSFFPEIDEGQWIAAIRQRLSPELLGAHTKAFYEGRTFEIQKYLSRM